MVNSVRYTKPSAYFGLSESSIFLVGDPVIESEMKVFRYICCFACNDLQRSSSIEVPVAVNCQICCLADVVNSILPQPISDVLIFLDLIPIYFNHTNGSFGWVFIRSPRWWSLSLDIMSPYLVFKYSLASQLESRTIIG